jgi:hypothetical protein
LEDVIRTSNLPELIQRLSFFNEINIISAIKLKLKIIIKADHLKFSVIISKL